MTLLHLSNRAILSFHPGSSGGKATASGRADARGGAAPALALNAKKVSNIFVHLRKIAQHPMLVRSAYSDALVEEIAALAHKR